MKLFQFILIAIVFWFQPMYSFSQGPHYIKVFFLYGSKPAHHGGTIEKREFGGLHGGHVSIGLDSTVVSFHHTQGYHIFPHRKKLRGIYGQVSMKEFDKDTTSKKYTTFVIPLDSLQMVNFRKTVSGYLATTPYDYTFFGMRCAAAAYDMLSHACVFKRKPRFAVICSNFYPKLLRRKCFKLAAKKHYAVFFQKGRKTRIWERD